MSGVGQAVFWMWGELSSEWGELSSEWGELSSECGASCLGASFLWSGMKPKVRARAPELSPEPGYLIFRFFQIKIWTLFLYIS